MEEDALMLRDVVPAETLIQHPGLPWWAIALIALGGALLLTLIVWLIRRKPTQHQTAGEFDVNAAYKLARQQIEEAAGLPSRDAATRISGAIRLYLSKVCKDPSLYETHEEFLGRQESLRRLPEITREHVSNLLSHLADMKYDRATGSPSEGIEERPLSVLRQIHQEVAA